MRIHLGKAGLALVGLAEVGAVVGAGLAWCYLVAHSRLVGGAWPLTEPGAVLWALVFGAPVGAVVLPLLAATVLRRVPIGRAVGLTAAGTACGLAVAAVAVQPVAPGAIPPLVPTLLPALAGAGTLLGAWAARRGTARLLGRNGSAPGQGVEGAPRRVAP